MQKKVMALRLRVQFFLANPVYIYVYQHKELCKISDLYKISE